MPAPLRLKVAEADFQATLVGVARALGWRCVHFGVGWTSGRGWKTAARYDAVGWPDLIMVKNRLIAVECKATDGRLSAEQQAWLDLLREAGIESYCWSAADWDQIHRVLMTRETK